MRSLLDFIFTFLKSLVRVAVITVIGIFILLILTILMPDNAAEAINILKNLK